MNYWLLKSEPNVYSFDMLVSDKKGVWDGVRNYQARNNLKEMKLGDLALFYHSNIGKEVVGIVKITKENYPDPTIDDVRWVVVEVQALKKLSKTVTLAQIKSENILQQIGLLKQSRLSVIKLKKEEFDYILLLGDG